MVERAKMRRKRRLTLLPRDNLQDVVLPACERKAWVLLLPGVVWTMLWFQRYEMGEWGGGEGG